MLPLLKIRRVRTAFAALAVTGTIVLGGCNPPHTPEAGRAGIPARVQVKSGGRVVSMTLDDYVLGTVLAEVGPVDDSAATTERIFEIQAIVARTYAAAEAGRHRGDGYDFCDTTHCQVYDPARLKTSKYADLVRQAVERTKGRVILYGHRPVEALFHADCGGYTASPDTVWSGGRALPYLSPEPDTLKTNPHRPWKVTLTADKLRTALNADASTSVGKKLDDIKVASRDVGGRAITVTLKGEHEHTVRGEQFRDIIAAKLGAKTIQSTKLRISKSGSSYTFEGTGFGHGVGLCQVGAAARAKRGDSVETILTHYFPGASVTR